MKVVHSLAEARRLMTANSFDAVLVDYDLDDGKGTELAEEIRDFPHRPYIIAASSHTLGNRALMEAGADAICDKMNFSNIGAVLRGAQPAPYQAPTTARELIQRYAEGERIFFDVELPHPDAPDDDSDFNGAHLEGIVFEGCYLAVSFRDAYLANSQFRWNVKTCIFDGADLRNASFRDCNIDAATFESANLEGTDFTGAIIQSYTLKAGERP